VRDVRVHDARRPAATLLIEQGVHIRVVQEILGHTRLRQPSGIPTSPRSDEGRERADGPGAVGPELDELQPKLQPSDPEGRKALSLAAGGGSESCGGSGI
jgi:Phage integrase family